MPLEGAVVAKVRSLVVVDSVAATARQLVLLIVEDLHVSNLGVRFDEAAGDLGGVVATADEDLEGVPVEELHDFVQGLGVLDGDLGLNGDGEVLFRAGCALEGDEAGVGIVARLPPFNSSRRTRVNFTTHLIAEIFVHGAVQIVSTFTEFGLHLDADGGFEILHRGVGIVANVFGEIDAIGDSFTTCTIHFGWFFAAALLGGTFFLTC